MSYRVNERKYIDKNKNLRGINNDFEFLEIFRDNVVIP